MMQLLPPGEGARLVAFLTARLTEKADAQLDLETAWHSAACGDRRPVGGRACPCGVPAFVLRSVTAERVLLGEFERATRHRDRLRASATWAESPEEEAVRAEAERTARLLAAEYIDHPEYREDWRMISASVTLTADVRDAETQPDDKRTR
ncbi:DUF6221 family protein [Streptomyces halstedii]|uniref:Uncharacterized protein n=1 Tax=Streptomyces halstedii TaxID=1944 RepID=A0A6N9UC29_STRHA|nr:DUF6221 family protein [Streptomyces halstedii]NEA20182.1 hypothetical protein [Streptomyces halstedii]